MFVAAIGGSSTRHWEAGKDCDIRLVLGRDARLERAAQRKGGQSRASAHMRGWGKAMAKPRKGERGGMVFFYLDDDGKEQDAELHVLLSLTT